ncbi:MAG: cytochrome c oxidase assembly protein [Chloroflexota bacterium]|nr:cytochrome c oxidase assembly protein [Chloroflexota bacterium]
MNSIASLTYRAGLPPMHGDPWLLSGPFWTTWIFDASVVVGVLALAAWYIWAVGPLNRNSPGAEQRPISTGQRISFLAGCVALAVAWGPPLEDWAGLLLTAHMAQHVILTLVVPPLLIYGTPGWLLRPLLRWRGVERAGYVLTRPVVALVLSGFTFIIWHVPDLYNLALVNEPVHILQHVTYLATSLLLWWPILGNLPEWPRLHPLPMCLYLFAQTLPGGIVGAFITMADPPLYGYYATVPRAWGIDLARDQQAAGLMMWLGVNTFYFLLITIVFLSWATREEAKDREQSFPAPKAVADTSHSPSA